MSVTTRRVDGHVAVVTMHAPPVNALTVEDWFAVARAMDDASADPEVRCVVLRAEGRGFNAGVDIKEMQTTSGFDAILGANDGCYAAFKAIYECAVPVVAAVDGHCIGGGVGLVGNCDVVLASDRTWFSVPEVNQGALGAATHMARLVPQHLMRTLYFTAGRIAAQELVTHGSVYRITTPEELDDAALELAAVIASKHPTVIRAAKAALNGIDTVDVNKSYRFEQGFTFELNMRGVADELRDDFAGTDKARRGVSAPTTTPTGAR
jgi:enoyl-CoA hydratase